MKKFVGTIFAEHCEATAEAFMAEARIFAHKNWIQLNKD